MIDARRLRILRAVADHRTVTAAAAALYLTPSAVSQQLAALEQETGHRLVERGARGARLTAAGEILLSHTNLVLAQLERAEAELADYSAGVAGTVTVAAFATGIGLVLAPALTELARTAPGIRVKVQDAEGDASVPMVLDRQVDVAVAVEYRGAPAEDDRRLTRVPLYSEPFDAVLPVGHRLADQAQVAVADLAKDPWIGPYPGNPCHDVAVLACEFAGFVPRMEHSSDDFRAVVALAGRTRGWPWCRVPRCAGWSWPGWSCARSRAAPHPPGLRRRTPGGRGPSADPAGAGRAGGGGRTGSRPGRPRLTRSALLRPGDTRSGSAPEPPPPAGPGRFRTLGVVGDLPADQRHQDPDRGPGRQPCAERGQGDRHGQAGSDRPSSPRRSARPADGSAATRPAAKYPAIAPHSSQCCPFGRTSSPWATAEPSAVASATRKPVITACSSIASLGASVPSRSRGMPLVPYSRLSVQTAASRANAPRPVAASGRSQCSRSEAASMIWMTPSPSTMITYSPSRSPMCAVSIRDSLSRGGSGAGEWAGPAEGGPRGGARPARRPCAGCGPGWRPAG